jgi:hypothetical protein
MTAELFAGIIIGILIRRLWPDFVQDYKEFRRRRRRPDALNRLAIVLSQELQMDGLQAEMQALQNYRRIMWEQRQERYEESGTL